MTATATLSKGVDLRAGASTHPLMKGAGVEDITPGEYTASTLLKHMGGDFQVVKRPLLVSDGEGGTFNTGMFGIVEESDDGLRLHGGSVSDRYPIYQFVDFAAHVDETLDRLMDLSLVEVAEIEAGFLLRGGALALFVIDLGLSYTVGGTDLVQQKYIASSGHGGESAVKNFLRAMRFQCMNQLPSLTGRYRKGDGILYEQHTAAGLDRASRAPQLAELAITAAKNDAELAEILASVPQGIADLERFLREGPGSFTATTEQGKKGKETKIERVLTRFASEPGNAWGAYNAIGWYEETKGDDAGALRQVKSLNRGVDGNHTPRATKYVDFILPDSVKAQYSRN